MLCKFDRDGNGDFIYISPRHVQRLYVSALNGKTVIELATGESETVAEALDAVADKLNGHDR